MTPFDRASLSLSGSELPPPTVGGSPFTSGGHVARLSGDGGAVDCASETFAAATVTNTAMIGTAKRKGNSFRGWAECVTTCNLLSTLPTLVVLAARLGNAMQRLCCFRQ
jgi:hypothetical protein